MTKAKNKNETLEAIQQAILDGQKIKAANWEAQLKMAQSWLRAHLPERIEEREAKGEHTCTFTAALPSSVKAIIAAVEMIPGLKAFPTDGGLVIDWFNVHT